MKQDLFYQKSAQVPSDLPNESHNSSLGLDSAIDVFISNPIMNNVSDNVSVSLLDQSNISAIEPFNEDLSVDRSTRKRQITSYTENGSDLSDEDDDLEYIPTADESVYSDSENPYVPRSKKSRNDTSAVSNLSCSSLIIMQSTPKRRGRPKGAKNIHSERNKSCYKSDSKWNSSSHVKLGKKRVDKNVNVSKVVKQPENFDFVDDKENTYPSDEVIAQYREKSSHSVTGCNSPVKKKSPKKSKKVLRNPQLWKKNILKSSRNSGQKYHYHSKTSGETKTHEAAKIGGPCDCSKKCTEILEKKNPRIIPTIFENYWGIGNYDLQIADLVRKTERKLTERHKKFGAANLSRVKGRTTYFIYFEEEKYYVCRKAFASIHGVSLSKLDYLHNKRDKVTGGAIADQRGKHDHHNQISEDRKNMVHEHIRTLPVRASHYTRSVNPFRQYLDYPDRTSTTWCYKNYVTWLYENYPKQDPVKESYYEKIFTTCYNIHSNLPKTDVCDNCNRLRNRIEEAQKAGRDYSDLQKELDEHLAMAAVAYENLKLSAEKTFLDPDKWHVICMDLQQTHCIPKTNIGSHYFLRKLNVYNFCISDIKTKTPYFYIWPEYTGQKGAAEIYSSVFKYLNDNVFCKSDYPKKLRIYADNCGGQNKNNKIVLAMLRLVHLGVFNRIELAFLVPGHSYMPCDREFGAISNQLKKFERIASPDILVRLIKTSRQQTELNVTQLSRDEIYNLDVFTEKDKDKRVALIRSEKGKAFSTASIIVMKKSLNNGYLLKKNFKETDEQAVLIDVQLPKATEHLDLGMIQLEPKYKEDIKLDDKKLEDLKTMGQALGSTAGEWIDTLSVTQSQLKGQVLKPEECESYFPEETWGRNAIYESDMVKQVSPENSYQAEKENEKKKTDQ